ncbi:MAG: hypothetical protein ABII23_03365, partial [bacterium]
LPFDRRKKETAFLIGQLAKSLSDFIPEPDSQRSFLKGVLNQVKQRMKKSVTEQEYDTILAMIKEEIEEQFSQNQMRYTADSMPSAGEHDNSGHESLAAEAN